VAEECGLAALQFHGDEAPEDVAQHRLPVIKTIKVEGPGALARIGRHAAAAYLLDSTARWSEGEARAPISWEVAKAAAAAGHRIVLAAGLTPDNVAAAVRAVRPYAVDVASGVEARPAVKDPDKVRRFIAAARSA
jgi:phosphoribosylanthranilate isomerase